MVLSHQNKKVEYKLGDTVVVYALKGQLVELSLYPLEARGRLVERRTSAQLHPQLPVRKFREVENRSVDSLAQVALRGVGAHGGWTSGASMRKSKATESMDFVRQGVSERDGQTTIETVLASPFGFELRHSLIWRNGAPGVRISTEIENVGDDVLELEMLSSFSLANLTPFAADDAPNRLRLHRFRSQWSSEARHEAASLEALSLERTWAGCPASLRYGATGSLPVRNFHPFAAIEDTEAGVFWGAQLCWHGSWQMEVYREDDPVHLSGGLGDFERAQWMKRLSPGERFIAPMALLACGEGDLDALCHRLVSLQEGLAYAEPAHESELPIIFNEWCSTWGNPSHDYLLKTADRLAETQCKYLVIDDGWAERPEGVGFQYNGDWNVSAKAFPEGLAATAKAIRQRGLIPGIWFEFEPCTQGTEAFEKTDHQLHRHGKVIQVGSRHFWDFRDPWTEAYLTEKVIHLLRKNDIGYLKVDYNESIGVGCDGAESLGEGLRQHLEAVKGFFEKIRRELPDLVIENCSSGGHRAEPGMVALTSMTSVTDAHETVELPIIVAQMQRLVPVRKNQVWAVIRPDDSLQRIAYSMAATFLGRMCVSGDFCDLSEDRFALVNEAQNFYVHASPILRKGRSRLIDHIGKSRRLPTGWQAVVREAADGKSVLVVLHGFELQGELVSVSVPLGLPGEWAVQRSFNLPEGVVVQNGALRLPSLSSFQGCACVLQEK